MDVNTTPLIDVMLVLLVMLIITIPIQLHSVKLEFPPGNPPPVVPEPPKLTVDIDLDGTISLDGQTISEPDLEAKFKDIGMLPSDKLPNVLIHPNKIAPYKIVAKVMAAAQRNHVTKLGLIGDEQFL